MNILDIIQTFVESATVKDLVGKDKYQGHEEFLESLYKRYLELINKNECDLAFVKDEIEKIISSLYNRDDDYCEIAISYYNFFLNDVVDKMNLRTK